MSCMPLMPSQPPGVRYEWPVCDTTRACAGLDIPSPAALKRLLGHLDDSTRENRLLPGESKTPDQEQFHPVAKLPPELLIEVSNYHLYGDGAVT
jgi:hypothetical protein